MQSYVTPLRKLAASSEYGALTDELIGERLVSGLKNQGDKVRLRRMNAEERDLQFATNFKLRIRSFHGRVTNFLTARKFE